MRELPFKMIQEAELELWRAETFFSKEPETIAWIDSFYDGDIFFDVGANIGVYSLYCAAKHPKSLIYAFEPMYSNYMRLTENRSLNNFKNIRVFPNCIGAGSGVIPFAYNDVRIGSSGGQMGMAGRYQVYMCSLDSFLLEGVCPQHVKIDIDGQEDKVVAGMIAMLKDMRLESVLIEINDNYRSISRLFRDNGFTTNNIFNSMTPHSRERRAAEGIKAENIIFTRR